MPAFTYAGQVPRFYTELRDEHGEIVGHVGHGDVRDLEDAPSDGFWLDGEQEVSPAWDGTGPGMYRIPEGPPEQPAGEVAAEPEPETPAPFVPVPPEVPDDNPAGVTAGPAGEEQ